MNRTCASCIHATGDWCSARLERVQPDDSCAGWEPRDRPTPDEMRERFQQLREAAQGQPAAQGGTAGWTSDQHPKANPYGSLENYKKGQVSVLPSSPSY